MGRIESEADRQRADVSGDKPGRDEIRATISKMKSLKIKEIRTDAGTQIRVRLNEDTVAEYAESFTDGAQFPPVVVFHDGNENILADGFHRVMGAIRAGLKDVLADIRKGSRTDALKYALGANSNHGLKRTNADKRNSIDVALKEWPKLSSAELGRICCVHHSTVEEIRKSNQPADSAGCQTRIGGDGKERKMPVPTKPTIPVPSKPIIPIPVKSAPLEKTVHIPIKSAPVPPVPQKPKEPEAVLDKTGWPISEKLLPIWERSGEVQELLSAISKVKGALRKAQEDKDKLFAEVSFSSALAHLDQAFTDIKTAMPYAVCPTCQGKSASSCVLCKGRGFISEFKWKTVVPSETKAIREKAKVKS